MATTGSKDHERQATNDKLDPQEHREVRSGAGSCQYMTEQRFDIAFSTKEIMRDAAGPTTASKTKLKRIRRYLKVRPARCVLNFPSTAKLENVIHVTVNADWAGGPKTQRSTSGGLLTIGPCITVRLSRLHKQLCHYLQLNQMQKRSQKVASKGFTWNICWDMRLQDHSKLKFGQTAAAP